MNLLRLVGQHCYALRASVEPAHLVGRAPAGPGPAATLGLTARLAPGPRTGVTPAHLSAKDLAR